MGEEIVMMYFRNLHTIKLYIYLFFEGMFVYYFILFLYMSKFLILICKNMRDLSYSYNTYKFSNK